MAIHSLNSLEMTLLASAFSSALPTSSVGNRPAENVLPNLSTTAVVPGSWAYEQRGQPNEEPIVKVAVDVKEAQATKKTRGSDIVAEGMM